MQSRAIDLHVFQHALNVIARFREGDAFNPVDRIDIGIAGIAVILDPLIGAVRPGIIGHQGKDIGAVILVDDLFEMVHAEREIIVAIIGQPVETIG